MPKYINAEELLAEAKRLSGPETGDGWDNWGVYALIERQPAADVVTRDCYDRLLAENDELRKERPVRHGRWVDGKGELVPWDEMNENCPRNSAYCSVKKLAEEGEG